MSPKDEAPASLRASVLRVFLRPAFCWAAASSLVALSSLVWGAASACVASQSWLDSGRHTAHEARSPEDYLATAAQNTPVRPPADSRRYQAVQQRYPRNRGAVGELQPTHRPFVLNVGAATCDSYSLSSLAYCATLPIAVLLFVTKWWSLVRDCSSTLDHDSPAPVGPANSVD